MRRIAGRQQLEEIQPAFGTRGCEGSKLLVADMRAKAILGLVARTGIVNRDPIPCASLRKASWLSIRSRMTWRLDIAMPRSLSKRTNRGTVICPCTYCRPG